MPLRLEAMGWCGYDITQRPPGIRSQKFPSLFDKGEEPDERDGAPWEDSHWITAFLGARVAGGNPDQRVFIREESEPAVASMAGHLSKQQEKRRHPRLGTSTAAADNCWITQYLSNPELWVFHLSCDTGETN